MASLLWGLVYVLCERLYAHVHVTTVLAAISFVAFIGMSLFGLARGTLGSDLQIIASSKSILLLTIAVTLVFMMAELCIGFSISGRNATLAALIEISYPFFTALFAAVLFRENYLSVSVLVGGLFIMFGVMIISIFNY